MRSSIRIALTSLVLACLPLLATGAAGAEAASKPLRVVATIPDLADIVREIGGERVEVRSIARGPENIHSVRVRPSLIVAMNKADLFVQMGLSMEHTYVPNLLQTARNARVMPGKPGFLDCSVGWEAVDLPANLDRSQGPDIHPGGNPHFNLDPRGGAHIAGRVLEALKRLDPASSELFTARHAAYLEKLDAARKRWSELAKGFEGMKVVAYHRNFTYFASAYGIEVVDTVEPKPGLAPTPRHLASLIRRMQAEKISVILTAPWSNNRSVADVSKKTGARVVELPVMVGGVKSADSWISMMDLLHKRLHEAFQR